MENLLKKTKANDLHRLGYIDGLRGLSILLIVINHLYQFGVGEPSPRETWWQEISWGFGAVATLPSVSLFFIVSAYTIFRSANIRFSKEANPIRNFFIRRVFRVLPLWWFAVFATGIFKGKSLYELLQFLFFYFGFTKYRRPEHLVMGEWTLFVEESFYLVFPWILTSFNTLRNSLVFLGVALGVAAFWHNFAPALGVPDTHSHIQCFPLGSVHFLAIGTVLYHLLKRPDVQASLDKPSTQNVLDFVTIISVLVLFPLRQPWIVPALFLLFFTASRPETLVGRWIRSGFLQGMGVLSYSIYLSHGFIIESTAPIREWLFNTLEVQNAFTEIRILVWLPVFAVLQGIVAVTLHQGIEKPFIQWGKRLIDRLEARDNAVTKLELKTSL